MAMVRRSRYALFYLDDSYMVDIAALFEGTAPQRGAGAIVALSVLTGERHPLSREELEVLMSVPAERWVEADLTHSELVRKGLLLSDSDDPEIRRLRSRDEALSANEWNLYAALYHHMTRWHGVDIRGDGPEEIVVGPDADQAGRAFVARHGPPPAPFPEPRGAPSLPLPGGAREGALYRALDVRRTTRVFDRMTSMTAEDLGTVLHYVFGCHGYARANAGLVCIKRTSPSGGGLHPIEAYPIVRDVRGIQPGIYHYAADRHALVPIADLDADAARRTSTAFMCGQNYFGAAHVTFVLAARFYRSHWKYRRHQKAYAAILMDAAHLSQTLYLVCAELGLGAFVTVAINNRDIDDVLGFDAVTDGAVAMLGCGPRGSGPSPLELDFSAERQHANAEPTRGSGQFTHRSAGAALRQPRAPIPAYP
jgi:putative peptide maturation dehydrogenase